MFKTIKNISAGFILGAISMLAFIQFILPKSAEMIDKDLNEVTKGQD